MVSLKDDKKVVSVLAVVAIAVVATNYFLYSCTSEEAYIIAEDKFYEAIDSDLYDHLRLEETADAYFLMTCKSTTRNLANCAVTMACSNVAFLNKHTCVDPAPQPMVIALIIPEVQVVMNTSPFVTTQVHDVQYMSSERPLIPFDVEQYTLHCVDEDAVLEYFRS